MKLLNIIMLLGMITSCNEPSKSTSSFEKSKNTAPSLVILGTVQDAGSPHIACRKKCCQTLFLNPDKDRKVVSLGLIDPENRKTYLFEATPDMPEQMKLLKEATSFSEKEMPNGIFLTHAHIGHYTGLMYLGKEAMNANKANVYAMPGMKTFLEQNGPWDQLANNDNIAILELYHEREVSLSSSLKVIPFLVPHRDEYSETVGYRIIGPDKSALFIPDIDKWQKWETSIIEKIAKVDYAFLDATFYDGEEINNRDISAIPHPFIIESMSLFENLPDIEKSKIYFIHFNHTNPTLISESQQSRKIIENGFKIARIHDVIEL